MTEKQRLFAVLDGETPDKTPWYADMIYYYHYLEKTNKLRPEWQGDEGYFRLCRDLKCGIMFYGAFPFRTVFDGGVGYYKKIEGNKIIEAYQTPVGSISSKSVYSDQSFSEGITKHMVETIEDFRVMCYVFEHMHYTENYQEIERFSDLVGDDGVVINLPPICVAPIQKLTSRFSGIENLVNFAIDEQDEFEEILHRIEHSEKDVYDIICGCKQRYVEFADNLSSEITGKHFFEQYNLPYYRKINEKLHRADKKVGIHIDGTLKPCLALLPKAGFDVGEAVTPFPVGDIPLCDLRKTVGEDFIIWGGIPGALFSSQYSENFFDDYLLELKKYAKPGEKFIVGVADQVPPDAIISRMQKVRNMVEHNAL